MVKWLNDQIGEWSDGLMIRLPTDGMANLFDGQMVRWLNDWMVEWSNDWMPK